MLLQKGISGHAQTVLYIFNEGKTEREHSARQKLSVFLSSSVSYLIYLKTLCQKFLDARTGITEYTQTLIK